MVPLLAFIFFFSGFASLIYQVSWQSLLTVYYGVGSVSIILIVSVYMLGLGLGALVGGILSENVRGRITLYCIVELLIGFFGLVSLFFLEYLGRRTAGSSYPVSFVCMFLFLCIPTFLMGITLPLLTKIFNRIVHNFLVSVSYLYFINTLGAAAGAIFGSYVIVSFFGFDNAIYIAAAINFVLAALIFYAKYLPKDLKRQEGKYIQEPVEDRSVLLGKAAYFLVFVTGFLAIGYEIVWFRVIGILVKASPYAFSTILAVYLVGIALGSFGMSKYLYIRKAIGKRNLFFFIQFLIGLSVIVTFIGYYYLTRHSFLNVFTKVSFSTFLHPDLSVLTGFSPGQLIIGAYKALDVFFWPAVFVLVPAVLMGASFPLLCSLSLMRSDREGSTVGTVYFFNIIGNVMGGILTGFVLLAFLGSETTLLVFSSVGLLFGLFITSNSGRRVGVLYKVLIAVLIAFNVMFFPKSHMLYKTMHVFSSEGYEVYSEEGIDGVIMTYQKGENVRNYINGMSHGGRPVHPFYFETIEAAAFAPKADNVLIIGFGTGTITETVLKVDDVRRITLVELSSTLMKNLEKMRLFRDMLSDDRIDLVIGDGRRFLLRTDEEYDLILLDPLRTTTSYSNKLYSKQFFELVKKHLAPGGIFMVWMDEYKVMPKTVASVFDHVRMYNFFCLGSDSPFKDNEIRREELLASFPPAYRERIENYGKYLGDRVYIEETTRGYPVNQDWKPVCEYYIGLFVREKLFMDK